MTDFTVPQHVVDRQQLRARARRPRPCLLCRQWVQTVLYPAGWHCVPCADSAGLTPVHGAPGAYPEHLRGRRATTSPGDAA